MSTLSTLKLVTVKKPSHIPAIQHRRNKLSTKLWEQINLAQSQIDGNPFVVMKFRSIKDIDTGLRKQVEIPKRMKAWWFVADNGKVCFSVKYGTKTLELAKGMLSVGVDSAQGLVKALTTIKSAIEAGELDSQIEDASNNLRKGFGK